MVESQKAGDVYQIKIPTIFDTENIQQLINLLDEITSQKGPKAIIFHNTGSRLFSRGLKVSDGPQSLLAISQLFVRLLHKLITLPVPTVSYIQGHVYFAGLYFALGCDYRY